MIDRETISELVNRHIEGTDIFVVDIQVSVSNSIRVLIDNIKGVNVKDCADLSRALESKLNSSDENFDLEVSSPGLSEPLKVIQQYRKNRGRDIQVITKDGLKHEGRLVRITDNGLVLEEMVRIRTGKKRPEIKPVENSFDFDRISSTKVLISIK